MYMCLCVCGVSVYVWYTYIEPPLFPIIRDLSITNKIVPEKKAKMSPFLSK